VNTEQAMTVKPDIKTAQKILFRAKGEIALGCFHLDEFVDRRSNDGITLGEFRDRFLENRQKLVHIGHLSKATYEHDQLSLNTISGSSPAQAPRNVVLKKRHRAM
jgi:hypothetical protein